MKKICAKYEIPTAKFKVCKNEEQIKSFLAQSKLPLVVKADGLAAGKGVNIESDLAFMELRSWFYNTTD